MKDIFIVGSGQQANVVIYNALKQNKYHICGLLDIVDEKWGGVNNNVEIIEGYKDFDVGCLDRITSRYGTRSFFIGIGNMKLRKKLYTFFVENGWEAVNIFHPNSVISENAQIGKGVLVEAGCLVTPNPIIGDNVVINTGSQVNHDNIIHSNVYIASGVVLSGGVEIGDNTLIDDGVIVTLGKKIGDNCIIGAGSVVTKDIPDGVVAYGNPCRIIRDNHL